MDKITIEKAIKKAEAEQREHLRRMNEKGNVIGGVQKKIKEQEQIVEDAQSTIKALDLSKDLLGKELHEMKLREGEIKGTIAAFKSMLETA